MLTPDTAGIMALAGLAAFVGAISGFGFALLLAPPLSFLVGPKEAVVLVNLLGATHNAGMFALLRRRVSWRRALPLAAVAFVGMPFGFLVLALVPGRALGIIIAMTVFLATLAIWRGRVLPIRGRPGSIVAGFFSGVLNTSTSMNGPPVVLYLAGEGLEPLQFRATLSAFFVGSSAFALFLYIVGGRIDGEVATRVLLSLPALGVGWLAGSAVFARLSGTHFRSLVLGMLVVSAALLLGRSLLG